MSAPPDGRTALRLVRLVRLADWRPVMAVALCACLLGPTWVVDFRDSNQRSAGPAWGAEVAKATAQCRRAPSATVSLAIDPPGWDVSVPCRDLLR